MTAVSGDDGRIRVLWLTKGLGPGGAERLLLSFAQMADHDRFEFHASYLLPWKDHLVDALADTGVHVHCLDSPRAADPRWTGRLRTLIHEHRIDVVHNHSPLVAAQARLAIRSLPTGRRPALVGTEHNVWSSHNAATRLLNRATVGLEAHTLAVSNEVRDSMSGRLADRTEVLLHGVDVDGIASRASERSEARARHGLRDEELVVVTVANLRSNKDYPTMLEAARRLVDDGHEVTFLSVGQGPLEEELIAERDRRELGARFRFLGYQRDPIGVLAAGDVFCLSSRYEGLPISLLEALALGLPVVSTDVGGIPQAVTDGVEASLVPAGEPARLAEAISALRDDAVRRHMAMAARERSHAFGMKHAVDRQQQIYEQLA